MNHLSSMFHGAGLSWQSVLCLSTNFVPGDGDKDVWILWRYQLAVKQRRDMVSALCQSKGHERTNINHPQV